MSDLRRITYLALLPVLKSITAQYFYQKEIKTASGKSMTKITQYSAIYLMAEAGVDPKQWNSIPSPDSVDKTVREIEARGIKVLISRNAEEALDVLKKIIPSGAEVMNGSSRSGMKSILPEAGLNGRLYMT
jgi:L-lactate utilization protein LutB